MEPRFLIVNADDFGLTSEINRGIIEAHERGIVTSASLMVRYPAAMAAAERAGQHPQLSVGLHFEIAEWRYHQGQWQMAYRVVDSADAEAVSRELEKQLIAFERLMHRGPTHLDSHQHVHLTEPCRTVLLKKAHQLRVPLRACDPEISHCGKFYGQTAEGEMYPSGISTTRLNELLAELKPGWSEIGCHAGYAEGLDSVYRMEREEEIRVLCSPEVRRTLAQNEIQLRSFHDYLARPRSNGTGAAPQNQGAPPEQAEGARKARTS